MPFVTHFKNTDGQELPIAASTLITVEIPAAGSTAKGDWLQAADSTTEHYNQQAAVNAPKSSAVIPHCTDPSVFTDHGLTINYEEQLQGWVLWIDSLPETACTLTLLFINHSTEGAPCVLPVLGGGGASGGGGLQFLELSTGAYGEPTWGTNAWLLNEEDSAALSDAAEKEQPLIMKLYFSETAYAVQVAGFIMYDPYGDGAIHFPAFTATIPGAGGILIQYDGAKWLMGGVE